MSSAEWNQFLLLIQSYRAGIITRDLFLYGWEELHNNFMKKGEIEQ